MNKKKIIICLLVIFVFAPTFILITNKINNKKENQKNEISDYQKSQKVKEFAEKEQGIDPNNEISTNEGGYSGIFIKGKESLLKVMDTDGMMSVNNMLSEGFKYISEIHETSKSLDENSKLQYFNENKDKINYTFGIDNIDTFSIFLSDLNFIGEGRIKEATIEQSTVKKGEFKVGEVRFKLILKSTIGESQTFNIRFWIQEDNQKDSKLIYWY